MFSSAVRTTSRSQRVAQARPESQQRIGKCQPSTPRRSCRWKSRCRARIWRLCAALGSLGALGRGGLARGVGRHVARYRGRVRNGLHGIAARVAAFLGPSLSGRADRLLLAVPFGNGDAAGSARGEVAGRRGLCGLMWTHYLLLDWAGRAGVLGLGTTVWFIVAAVGMLRGATKNLRNRRAGRNAEKSEQRETVRWQPIATQQ